MSLDTACSSSMFALKSAYDFLQTGQADSAIVVGTNINLTPAVNFALMTMTMSSPEGKCKSFDASGVLLFDFTEMLEIAKGGNF